MPYFMYVLSILYLSLSKQFIIFVFSIYSNCFYQSLVIFLLSQIGEEIVSDDCSSKCTCDPDTRLMECVAYTCDVNAHCDVIDGDNACDCNDGYEGNGLLCQGKSADQ